jgi:hypothetical protein
MGTESIDCDCLKPEVVPTFVKFLRLIASLEFRLIESFIFFYLCLLSLSSLILCTFNWNPFSSLLSSLSVNFSTFKVSFN